MVAEVTGNPPKSVNQWSEMPKISPTPVQGGSGVDVAPKPTPGLAFGQGAALAQASPATRPKTVSPLQLTEINKARDHLKAAQTPDEVTAAKEELRRAVDNEMYRLSSHSRIYVVRSPTDRRDVGKRIVDQFAGDQDVREAIRGANYGHVLLDLHLLTGSIKDGQLKLTDTAAQEFIADAADWITAPDRGEGANVAALAHNQFTRLLNMIKTEASFDTSQEILAALVVQCRKEPDWIVSIESADSVSKLKNLIGNGNSEANAAIKDYEAAANYPTP